MLVIVATGNRNGVMKTQILSPSDELEKEELDPQDSREEQ